MAAVFLGAALCFPATALAQSYQVLHAFSLEGLNPQSALIQATDGNFYGTTVYGGASNGGTVFKVDSSGNLTTLHRFRYSDGGNPADGVIQATDGNFYGTTSVGGASGYGTVFKMDSSGNLATLHSFIGSDGANPHAGLIQATDGNFYGTTFSDSAGGNGTVFKVDSSGNLTTLHKFTGSDGSGPYAALVQATDGNLYGTTIYGGTNGGNGTVFKIDTNGATFISLHSFAGSDGENPYDSLIQAADGNFYGTTYGGGDSDFGTVFKMDSSGNLTTLHIFTGQGDGDLPYAGLIQATDGNFYGTTYGGGTFFRIDSLGNLTVLQNNLAGPFADLVQASDGNFYGTTAYGGTGNCPGGCGTVFKVDSSGNLTTLHSFGFNDSAGPYAGLIQATDGSFYGTTVAGGTFNGGSVFKIDSSGTLVRLHSFTSSTEGVNPRASVIQATDGNFYGTTYDGGSGNCGGGCGTVFKMDPAGNLATLHSFIGDPSEGSNPSAELIQATDGNFYGTTAYGGADLDGTVFKIDTSGNLTTLHSFTGSDGFNPLAGLIQATDGNLYGTTYAGGASGYGTVFKMDPSGNLTTLHSFAGGSSDGANPSAGLIEAADGNFYGATFYGGAGNFGTVFVMDAAGSLTLLHSFGLNDGANPSARLIQASDGDLYGTTVSGGANSNGTIFKMDLVGNLATLHSFSGDDGASPYSCLLQATDGSFYGTTSNGGSGGSGVVFQLTACSPAPTPVITVTECLPANTPGFIASVPGAAGDTYYWTLVGGTIDSGQGTNTISFTSGNPATLMSLSILETNSSGCSATAGQNLQVDYADEPPSDPFYSFVCAIGRDRVTAGCGGGNFCPTAPVTRAQMAVFLLVGEHGAGYLPPPCTGIFLDVPCPTAFGVDWIEELYNEGITGGCSVNPPKFCPNDPVTRAQMAVFLLVAEHGSGYTPPACAGIFGDVSCPSGFAVNWIEELYHEGITAGCSANPLLYCPDNPNTRGQMAVFLTKTFGLP